ncbi:MAG: MoaD/ThiS family protein [Methanosarcinaceae archaeon]|nr:MoaD/ThiS family protein [Methanosarcinaceae archaeon]
MAEVKIKLFANLRERAGAAELILSGHRVIDVLELLVEKYPDLEELIFEKEKKPPELCGYVNVLVNGDNVRHLDCLDTVLSDADELAILPPVSGG